MESFNFRHYPDNNYSYCSLLYQETAFFIRGLVLVCGNAYPRNRPGAGRQAGNGRQIYLPALYRHGYCAGMGHTVSD